MSSEQTDLKNFYEESLYSLSLKRRKSINVLKWLDAFSLQAIENSRILREVAFENYDSKLQREIDALEKELREEKALYRKVDLEHSFLDVQIKRKNAELCKANSLKERHIDNLSKKNLTKLAQNLQMAKRKSNKNPVVSRIFHETKKRKNSIFSCSVFIN